MTTTWAPNPLDSIEDLHMSLDYYFQARLKSNGCSLFRLFKLGSFFMSTSLTPLVEILLSYYDSTQNVFIFGSHRLRITLEDVLFITGLPISGKPVISSNSRDTDAFQRIFGPESNGNSLSMMELKSYAVHTSLDKDKRMMAVLLYVINSFITPTIDGQLHVATTYVEFVENLVEVDSYAWGAALLAFLYTGIKKWKDDKSSGKTKLSIDGNVWLLLCFFFIRIPKLMSAVGVQVDLIVENVKIVYKNYQPNYKENVVNILNNLSDEDIKWSPYDSSWLPPRLKDQHQFRAIVAPLFCNNYVVHHRPQIVLKQFGFSEGSVSGLERYDYEIKIKHNTGPVKPDYLTMYKEEIELWEEGKQLQDFISCKRCADVGGTSSSPGKKSKFDALRALERLRARMQGKAESSEAREKKLKSELKAALERIESLEGEIESSEAREEKLKSELRAAVERNAKLEGMIKHAGS